MKRIVTALREKASRVQSRGGLFRSFRRTVFEGRVRFYESPSADFATLAGTVIGSAIISYSGGQAMRTTARGALDRESRG